MFSIGLNKDANRLELTRTTHPGEGMKIDLVLSAPYLRAETDDNGPVVAALVRVAGDLLVAEYENQHSILNDQARAKTQALAFAEGFKAMTGMGPSSATLEAMGKNGVETCPDCHAPKNVGMPCMACEMNRDDDLLKDKLVDQ